MHCLPQEGVPRLTSAQVPQFVLSLQFSFHVILSVSFTRNQHFSTYPQLGIDTRPLFARSQELGLLQSGGQGRVTAVLNLATTPKDLLQTWFSINIFPRKADNLAKVCLFDAVAAHPHSFSILRGIPVVMPLICRGIGSIMFTMPPHWQNISSQILLTSTSSFSDQFCVYVNSKYYARTLLLGACNAVIKMFKGIPFKVLSSQPWRPILSLATIKCCTLLPNYL